MGNRINTNAGAMLSLRNLNTTRQQLNNLQNRIDTGLQTSETVSAASNRGPRPLTSRGG